MLSGTRQPHLFEAGVALIGQRASRLSGGGRFRIWQQSNVKGRLGYCAAGGIVGKRVTWERYEGGKGWNCERHKRFL